MISRVGYGVAGFVLLATSGLNGAPALAQVKLAQVKSLEDVPLPVPPKVSPWPDSADPQAEETPTEQQAAATGEDADVVNPDIDWSLLDVDASTLTTTNPKKPHLASHEKSSNEVTWTSQQKAYGSAVSVKQPVSPFLDTRVGADMTVVHQPTTLSELLAEKASNGGNEPQSSGTAWAAITAPGVAAIWDKTAVEARIDPAQDQGKLDASLSKQVTLSKQYSLTLQNGYDMIQGFAPLPGAVGRTTYATEQSAKFGITETGTSFSAGQTLSTTDDKWLRKIGAEQKIGGGLNISGSVAETSLGILNKSISAGFKQSW